MNMGVLQCDRCIRPVHVSRSGPAARCLVMLLMLAAGWLFLSGPVQAAETCWITGTPHIAFGGVGSGGATSSNPYVRYKSSKLRRSSSMRRASAGRISARLSGSNQLDIMLEKNPANAAAKQKATWGVSPPSRLRMYSNLRRIVPCCCFNPKWRIRFCGGSAKKPAREP